MITIMEIQDYCVIIFYEDYTTLPVTDIFENYDINFHICQWHTGIFVFQPWWLEACTLEVKTWMAVNWLQLNDNKTEFIVFWSKHPCILCNCGWCHYWYQQRNVLVGTRMLSSRWDIRYLPCVSQPGITCIKSPEVHVYVTSWLDENNNLLIGLEKKTFAGYSSSKMHLPISSLAWRKESMWPENLNAASLAPNWTQTGSSLNLQGIV